MRALLPALALALAGTCAPADAPPREEGGLVITEVMANPAGIDDADGEYFEVHNPGPRPVDLAGWSVADSSDAGPRPPLRIRGPLAVPPGGYVVLAASADRSRNGGIAAHYAFGGALQLANGGDALKLVAPSGRTVDRVRYASARAGVARELTDPALDNADVDGRPWADATRRYHPANRGTPGAARVGADPGEPAAPPASTAVYLDHLAFGAPRDADPSDDLVMEKREFVLSYGGARGGPDWVAWNLNATHFGDAERCDCFRADSTLPPRFRPVLASDYSGSGYTRGHMVRSEERTATPRANAATFLMTNILPQHADLNAGPWLELERYLERLAREEGRELYLVAGGAYPPAPATLRGEGRVAIPSHTWKIALVLPRGAGLADVASAANLEVVAVLMPNTPGIEDTPWRRYATTVDRIEAATGYDFLHLLPDTIEAVVERGG